MIEARTKEIIELFLRGFENSGLIQTLGNIYKRLNVSKDNLILSYILLLQNLFSHSEYTEKYKRLA